jgi:prepilin-type N-terminal cleavage/methylation domain-containing protein
MNKTKKKKGFTLVEIIIVMAIIIIFATMMVGIFNAIGVTNKGRDAQRKKDLRRIKIAFEEYFNDKGYFPDDVDTWNIKSNCSSDVFSPYLKSWPCDPNSKPYKIVIDLNEFRVITNLENEKDKDIPDGWYDNMDFDLMGWTINDVNYGVSSTNILWYEIGVGVNADCDINVCLSDISGNCSHIQTDEDGDGKYCFGSFCYYYDNSNGGSCTTKCRTTCCGPSCLE